MKKILLIVFFLGMCGFTAIHAQTPARVSITGFVTDFATKTPLPGSVVSIPKLNLWVVADARGNFSLPSVATGNYDIEVTCLGYEKLVYNVVVSRPISDLSLRLKESSLALNTVTVTATRGSELNSSSRIDQQAMQHIQASTLKGYMELIPGTVIENPSLTASQVISLRDITGLGVGSTNTNTNNARSVGFLIDGAQINDHAAIMTGASNTFTFAPSPSDGFDTRNISTEQIESIDVITGVASAEYGNLNAGAVIIKTKAGRTPYEVSVKTDPNSKIYSFGKGLGLGGNAGTLNVNVDYAKAFTDIRTDQRSFNRTGFSARYSNTFNKNGRPLNFNVSLIGSFAQGDSKADADRVNLYDFSSLSNNSVALNVNGSWQVRKPWLTALRYVLSYRVNNQFSLNSSIAGSTPDYYTGFIVEDGVYVVRRPAGGYIVDLRNESKAAYANGKLTADIADRYGSVFNKFSLGVEWDNSGNSGRGTYSAGETPHSNYRNLDASDYFPFVNKYYAFAEDRLTIPFNKNKSSVVLQAGGRFMYVASDVLKQTSAIDPRFNVKYNILQNRHGKKINELAIRAGWGIQTVLPYLQHMYNMPDFSNKTVISWADITDPVAGIITRQGGAIVRTFVTSPEDMINPDLKFQRSTNFEAGMEFKIFGVGGSVVYFKEEIKNGYGSNYYVAIRKWTDYAFGGTGAPDDYSSQPELVVLPDGSYTVTMGGEALAPTERYQLNHISRPANDNKLRKWGIEYTLDFGQIRSLRTSVMLTGQYMQRENRNGEGKVLYGTYSSTRINVNGTTIDNPYIAAYEADRSTFLGRRQGMLTTNLNFITHIPVLRMVASVTVQCIAFRTEQYMQASGLYHLDEDGNQVFGDYSHGWSGGQIYRDPVSYMDLNGIVHDFDFSLYSDPDNRLAFEAYRLTQNNQNFFAKDRFKPYFLGKIRLTKEISNIAQLSFYANNFTASNPQMLRNSDSSYQTMNAELFFGAELKIKF